MDGNYLSLYTCKCYIVLKQFDGLNFDGLAGKCQKHQNFSPSKFCAILVSDHNHTKILAQPYYISTTILY